MLRVFNEFERAPELLAEFDAVVKCYSASCVFAELAISPGRNGF